MYFLNKYSRLKSRKLHGVQESNLELSVVIWMTDLFSNSELVGPIIKPICSTNKTLQSCLITGFRVIYGNSSNLELCCNGSVFYLHTCRLAISCYIIFLVIYSGTEKSILSIRVKMLFYSMTKHRIHASPAIIGMVAAIAVVMTSTIVATPPPAFAIKLFFNCMTDKANEHGKLTLDDVHICLYKEYGVYNKVPYSAFIHSSKGNSGSGGR